MPWKANEEKMRRCFTSVQCWQFGKEPCYFFTQRVFILVLNLLQRFDALVTIEGLVWYSCSFHVVPCWFFSLFLIKIQLSCIIIVKHLFSLMILISSFLQQFFKFLLSFFLLIGLCINARKIYFLFPWGLRVQTNHLQV